MFTCKARKWIISATSWLVIVAFASAANAQSLAALKGAPPPNSGWRISGPYTKDNLTIFLIHGQNTLKGQNFLTLSEALEEKKVVVYETSNVNELSVENLSSELVFIQSGEIVKGGQQDRTFQSDMILPPHSGRVPIAAFCVEHGRWSQRGQEQVGNFTSSPAALPSPSLKRAAHYSQNQSSVWAEVEKAQGKLSGGAGGNVASPVSPSSLELSLENKTVQKNADDRCTGLEKIVAGQPDVIGYACAINGKVTGADVYGSNALFKKLWPKLLKASAIESLTEFQAGKQFRPAGNAEVTKFLSSPAKAKPSEANIGSRAREVKREATDCIEFQTEDRAGGNAIIHQNYLTK